MASTITAATLTVKITETINLNGQNQGGTNTLTIGSDILMAGRLRHIGDTDTEITFENEKITSTADSINIVGHITASGEISASGTILGPDLDINGIAIRKYDGALNITGASGLLTTNITASGNIKALGYISSSVTKNAEQIE